MKPLCVIAFLVAGGAWGWFLGGLLPAKDSYFMNQEAAQHLGALLGLIGGLFFGAIGGYLAGRFLPQKLIYIPMVVLFLGVLPLVITSLRTEEQAAQSARMDIENGKRDQALRVETKRVLDGFTRATGWKEWGRNWISRSYELSDDAIQVRARLESMGGTDVQALPGTPTFTMFVPMENHRLYVQLTPKKGGGSRVMVQY